MDIVSGSAVDRRRLTYRPGLDGVRALAVTAVLLVHHYGAYHARGWTSGGFLGVDVFFVLSGFLITSLLLQECAGRGTISLPSFWARRIRRLVPPLTVLAVGVAAYAIFRAPPAAADRIRDEGVATFLYVKNWHTIFSQVSLGTPFTQTWSLAIEEQWYIIWPPIVLLLVGVFKLRRPVLLTIIAGLAVASAVDMAVRYHGGWDLRQLYNGTDTRAQALLVGAALAVLLRQGEVVLARLERFLLEAAGIAALLMLVTLFFVSVQSAPWLYRGGFFYVALVSAVLIAAASQLASPILGRVLGFGPIRWIGLISYEMYIFHRLVYMWIDPSVLHVSVNTLFLVRAVLTVAVSAAVFYLVSRPIRRSEARVTPVIAAALVALATLVLVTELRRSDGARPLGNETHQAVVRAR